MIDRKNIVKLVSNAGKYLEEKADEIVPQNIKMTDLEVVINLSVDASIPRVTVHSTYAPVEVLQGVKFSKGR